MASIKKNFIVHYPLRDSNMGKRLVIGDTSYSRHRPSIRSGATVVILSPSRSKRGIFLIEQMGDP
jgi:hypothetical protein